MKTQTPKSIPNSRGIQTPAFHDDRLISATEVSRAPEVDQAFMEINDKHENVEKLIHALRDRLTPVLRNEPPAATMPVAAPEPPPYCTPMANRLHGVANDLHRDIRALEEILRLLEV